MSDCVPCIAVVDSPPLESAASAGVPEDCLAPNGVGCGVEKALDDPVVVLNSCENTTGGNEKLESSIGNSKLVCCPPRTLRYIQPERVKSCRPNAEHRVSTARMETNTVYRNSYISMEPGQVIGSRPSPIMPQNEIPKSCANIEKDTVTSLSYPGHFCVIKTKSIPPRAASLTHKGPMHDQTTHKHDFVEKPISRRPPILPQTEMPRTTASLERDTVNKLSYMKPDMDQFTRTVSQKPLSVYRRPEAPMDLNTTQKLSFMPVCPAPKDLMPWAEKSKFCMPTVPFEKDTVYKLSFIKNCGATKTKPFLPVSQRKLITDCCNFNPHTVYNQSFQGAGSERPPLPIRHQPEIRLAQDKLDTNTCYALSYPGHFAVRRDQPIRPNQRSLLGKGPMENRTTQKRDFAPKAFSRRCPVLPSNEMARVQGSLESDTINRLSYIRPNMENFKRAVPCKPISSYKPPSGCFDMDTTHKLSFMPVCPPPKEHHPWAEKSRFQMPSVRMETDTVQRMSYAPPGQYVEDATACCYQMAPSVSPAICFPTAAIV